MISASQDDKYEMSRLTFHPPSVIEFVGNQLGDESTETTRFVDRSILITLHDS